MQIRVTCAVRCTVLFGPMSRYEVTNFKASNLRRHHGSKEHADALRLFLKIDSLVGADSVKDFQTVWAALRKGDSGRQGIEGVGTYHKVRNMVWCLGEAIRDLDRSFLARPGVPRLPYLKPPLPLSCRNRNEIAK